METQIRSLLIFMILLTACAPQDMATPSPTLAFTNAPVATANTANPAPIPTLTSAPVAAAMEAPTIPQLPTVSLLSATFAPTDVIKSPFHLKVEIDEIIPGSHWARLWSTLSGNIWLITDKGVVRLSEMGWMDYLFDYEGYIVGIDSIDRVWVVSGTGDSISAWDGTRWKKYSSDDGWVTIRNAQTFDLTNLDYPKTSRFTELGGHVWISTNSDVYHFDGARWTIIKPEELQMSQRTTQNIPALSHLKVKALQEFGQIWVGECDVPSASLPSGSGARWFDASSNIWRAEWQFESGCVLVVEDEGDLWVAVDYRLWRYSTVTTPGEGPVGQVWDNFTPPETSTLTHSYIINLAISQAGEPWFLARHCGEAGCGMNTLYRLQNGVWASFSGYPFSQAREVFIDVADRAWLWTLDGLYRIVDNQPQRVPDLIVDDWATDDAGNIWVVGKTGAGSDKFALWLATP